MHPLPSPSLMMIGPGRSLTPGYLWTWGSGNSGSLGDGTTTARHSPVKVGANKWLQVTSGNYTVLAIRLDGTLWGWGKNGYGQLGDATIVDKSSPTQVGALTTWDRVYTGGRQAVAIKKDGTLWAWGVSNQILNGTGRSSPVQIGAGTDWLGARVGNGAGHVLIVKRDGTLWASGENSFGQLGDGTTTARPVLTQIGALTDWYIPAGSYRASAAIKKDGTLWTWGKNDLGQLGQNISVTTYKSSPVQVGALTTWRNVRGGGQTDMFAATTATGAAFTWGRGTYGQLGNGGTANQSSPVQVGALTNWANSVAPLVASNIGDLSVATVKTDGSLWGQGRGDFGAHQGVNVSSPVQIGAATDWIAVSQGSALAVALRK